MDNNTPVMWERLPNEGAKAFNAFTHFLGMPIVDTEAPENERSLFNVSQFLGYASSGHRHPSSTIEKWSAKYSWMDRASAYDSYMAATSITVKESSLVAYQQQVIERTTTQVIVLNQVIDRVLASLNDGLTKDIPEVPDALTIQRLAGAIKVKDDLARRVGMMPTTFRTEAVEEEADDDRVYLIGVDNG